MDRQDPLPQVVLDAFSLMAYLRREASGARVTELLRQARDGKIRVAMCVVNLGEVLYNHHHRYGEAAAEIVLNSVGALPITIVNADLRLTHAAAVLKARVKAAGRSMSYADSFAAALAQQLGATLVTGDPEFKHLEDAVRIEWL